MSDTVERGPHPNTLRSSATYEGYAFNGAINGPKRRYNYVAVVQGLADGNSLAALATHVGRSRDGVSTVVARLKKVYGVKTTPQLVAHFLRNGWID